MTNGKLENNEIQRLEEVLKIVFAPKKIFKKAEMAEFLGYKPPYFSGICNGKEKVTDQFLIKIQSNLGVNWNYVLTGDGEILLSAGGEKTAQVGEINNATGGVQNVSNNCGHVENNTTLSPSQPAPAEQSFSEVLQKLVETNAKLVETNAQLVAMLNININQ